MSPNHGEKVWGEENIFHEANNVSIVEVIQHFLPYTDLSSKKIICPIPSHKGGAENSASFHIHPGKNQFYCFGCKAGQRPIDFVVAMTGCTRVEAAVQLTTSTYSKVVSYFQEENQKERFAILLSFSQTIKKFREQFPEHSLVAEDLSEVFDALCSKHSLSNAALTEASNQLLSTLEHYESTYSW